MNNDLLFQDQPSSLPNISMDHLRILIAASGASDDADNYSSLQEATGMSEEHLRGWLGHIKLLSEPVAQIILSGNFSMDLVPKDAGSDDGSSNAPVQLEDPDSELGEEISIDFGGPNSSVLRQDQTLNGPSDAPPYVQQEEPESDGIDSKSDSDHSPSNAQQEDPQLDDVASEVDSQLGEEISIDFGSSNSSVLSQDQTFESDGFARSILVRSELSGPSQGLKESMESESPDAPGLNASSDTDGMVQYSESPNGQMKPSDLSRSTVEKILKRFQETGGLHPKDQEFLAKFTGLSSDEMSIWFTHQMHNLSLLDRSPWDFGTEPLEVILERFKRDGMLHKYDCQFVAVLVGIEKDQVVECLERLSEVSTSEGTEAEALRIFLDSGRSLLDLRPENPGENQAGGKLRTSLKGRKSTGRLNLQKAMEQAQSPAEALSILGHHPKSAQIAFEALQGAQMAQLGAQYAMALARVQAQSYFVPGGYNPYLVPRQFQAIYRPF